MCEYAGDELSSYAGLYFITGVTSWGSQACAEEPSVFASVATAAEWIADETNGKTILHI